MRQLLLALLFFLPAIAQAQQPARFLHYSVKDGLSQNSVHCIFRDRDGLVWIGTQDGLNSFDGKAFTVYRPGADDSTGISDQFVLRIKEDINGLLWIGTRNGLNSFDKRTKKFTRYYLNKNERHIFQAAYYDFFCQADGNVIVIKAGRAAILTPSTGRMVFLQAPEKGLANFFVLPDYKAYILTEDRKLFFTVDIRKKEFKLLASADPRIPIGEDAQTEMTEDGLLIFTDNRFNLFPFSTVSGKWLRTLTVPHRIIDVNANRSTDVLISSTSGILKHDLTGGTSSVIAADPSNSNSLPPGNILCTFTDREGNLWAGTAGNGVAVNHRSFENYLLIKNPLQNNVTSCVAKIGPRIYSGTRAGLFVLDLNNKTMVSEPFCAPLAGKTITAIAADARGRIWAAVQGEGLFCIDNRGVIVETLNASNRLPGTSSILHLDLMRNGNLIVNAIGAFYILENVGMRTTVRQVEVNGSYIMSSTEDSKGRIWVSHNSGIDVFNSSLEHLTYYKSDTDTNSFIRKSIVTGVAEDANGTIWIATIRSGIYRLENGRVTNYKTAAGLSSVVIYSLACDDRNRVWAATSAGLNVFNRETNSFSALTAPDGLPETAFSFGAVINDGNGNLIWGTSEGILIAKASVIELQKTQIRAIIENVRVNGQSISLTDNKFELVPDNKLIEFNLGSSPAFFSGTLLYQYRLRGQSDEWITLPQGLQMITYTGLPYRELIMEVRAATAESNLAAAPVSSITIASKAPFWKRPLFLLACFVMLAAAVWLALMEYNKKNYRKQLQLLRIEKELQGERVRIGRDLHDNIGAYTSALIAGLNHIRMQDVSQARQIDDLKDYGANIMGFLRETIWMLNTETLTITAFADRFKNYAHRIAKNYPGITLQIRENIAADTTLSPTSMLNIFRILQEALQNAFRHSEATAIEIVIESKETLCFRVKDNGKGFTETTSSESYGLANMRQRAKESDFDLTITGNAEGTVVQLRENTANAVSAVQEQKA